jgi:hypothetical protein
MKHPRAILFATLSLLFLLIFVQACATGTPTMGRQLIAVTITPTSGTAQGSPGQIQFVATGTYNTPPYTVTPLAATWGVESNPQAIATTTQNGLATCTQGSTGTTTTTIEAWVQIVPPLCDSIDSAGRPGCGNVGSSAKLTCP